MPISRWLEVRLCRAFVFFFLATMPNGCSRPDSGTRKAEDRASRSTASFLSDTNRSYKVLEHLQSQAYKSTSNLPRITLADFEGRDLSAYANDVRVQVDGAATYSTTQIVGEVKRILDRQPTTRYENAVVGPMLEIEFAEVLIAAKSLGYPSPTAFSIPALGTLPHRSINALTIRVGDRQNPIIAVNAEVADFLFSLTCRALEGTTYSRDGKLAIATDKLEVFAIHRAHPDLAKDIADDLVWYLDTTAPRRRNWRTLDRDVLRMAIQISHSTELFVLSHEYSHILFGHRGGTLAAIPLTGDPLGPDRSIDGSYLAFDWWQEFEADFGGLEIAVRACDDSAFPRVSRWGPYLVFSFTQLLDDADYVLRTGEKRTRQLNRRDVDLAGKMLGWSVQFAKGSGSTSRPAFLVPPGMPDHPPAWLRRKMLREHMKMSRLDDDITELGPAVEHLFDVLWDDIQTHLLAKRAAILRARTSH